MSVDLNSYDRESQILIVDDDQTLLKFFKIHLNKLFSKITVVKNAKEAMTHLSEHPVDVVLSDFRMPRTSGIQLLRKVKKSFPETQFVIVSGAMLSEKDQSIIQAEADGFISKPFGVEDLENTLKLAAQRKKRRARPALKYSAPTRIKHPDNDQIRKRVRRDSRHRSYTCFLGSPHAI